MPELTFQGRRVAYLEQGGGVPLILLHAGGSSGKQWVKTASLLEDRFRVVAPDLWGFGLTESWPGEESLTHDHQTLLVARVIAEVVSGPAHLVGHSYGGATALRLVLRRKDLVKTLILVEPILTPLLRLAGEEQAFREYFDVAQTFLSNAAMGSLEEAWQGSLRQARRYVDVAQQHPRGVPVPEPTMVFTVKLPVGLVRRVRARARATGTSLSALVTRALEDWLERVRPGPRGG